MFLWCFQETAAPVEEEPSPAKTPEPELAPSPAPALVPSPSPALVPSPAPAPANAGGVSLSISQGNEPPVTEGELTVVVAFGSS